MTLPTTLRAVLERLIELEEKCKSFSLNHQEYLELETLLGSHGPRAARLALLVPELVETVLACSVILGLPPEDDERGRIPKAHKQIAAVLAKIEKELGA